tara:strand:- start:6 stop:905 length:900 start_codon:yes stop_codon:yes gene_type:complete
MGQNGSDVFNIHSNTQNGDKCVIGQSEGGITHVYGDRTIEIVGGEHNPEGSVDIFITGLKGSIVINALENGDVCVKGRNINLQAKEDINITAGNNITIQAKNTLYLGPGKKGYCKFTETTKKPNWHAICGYQENLIGRAGLGLRASSLFNVAAAAATGGIGGPLATAAVSAATEMGASAVGSLPGGGVVSAVTGGGGLGDIASTALGAVGGGDLVGAVTEGAGIVGAATNVLAGGGLAPGAVLSNVAGQVVGDNVGSLVGTAGEVLGSPAPLASMAELDAELARAQAGDRSGLDEALDF